MLQEAGSAVKMRPARPEDASICGRICFEAFKTLAEEHGFPPDFPSVEIAIQSWSSLIAHPRIYGVVAELEGNIVGSNFLDERGNIAGVGPITVDPQVQNRGTGRALMLDVLQRGREKGFQGIRLVQAAYHNRSLSLYAKLGFVAREPLSTMQGPAIRKRVQGREVREATEVDLEDCNRLCLEVHGHDRGRELLDSVKRGVARVVEHDGEITGYATGMAFFAHSVGKTNDDMKALIGAASAFEGPGILVPTRNAELLFWSLEQGLRVVEQMTLMTIGLYNEPAGAYLPSVLY